MNITSAAPDLASYPSDSFLTMRDLAALTQVSHSTIRKWSAAGPASRKLPTAYRFGNQIRFHIDDVRTWIAEQAVR